MKSKKPKPVPKGNASAKMIPAIPHRPYSISDFIEEMKSPMPFIDIVSRVHLLTGFNKSALIMLRRHCGEILGYRLWEKIDVHYSSSKLKEVKIGKKTFMVNTIEMPKHHHTFLIDFLDALIVGRDVDPFFTGIDPDDYDKHVFGESKLTIRQIALICRYNGRNVTKRDAAKIAREYGHKGSTKLYDEYRNTKMPNERITWACETKKNRIQLDAIRPHLNDSGKAMWNDELKMVDNRKQ